MKKLEFLQPLEDWTNPYWKKKNILGQQISTFKDESQILAFPEYLELCVLR